MTYRRLATIPALAGAAVAMAWLALPSLFMLVPPVLALCLGALYSGVYAGYRKTEDAVPRQNKYQYGLTLAITLAGVYGLWFADLAYYFLSWPNRSQLLGAVQVFTLIGLAYYFQIARFALIKRRLPDRLWPMRFSALGLGGLVGALFVVMQLETSQEWSWQRQQPLVDALTSETDDQCAAFKRYLAEHPQKSGRMPVLHFGAVPEQYDGQPLFVLAFHATDDLENLIYYYYSGSRKWKVTYTDNRRGMEEFKNSIAPLARCSTTNDAAPNI